MLPVVTSITVVTDTRTQWAEAGGPGIELAALRPAAGVTSGFLTGLLRPGEIKPCVSGFPLGPTDPGASTQQRAGPAGGDTRHRRVFCELLPSARLCVRGWGSSDSKTHGLWFEAAYCSLRTRM